MALVRVGNNPTYSGTNEAGVKSKESYLPYAAFQKPVWDEILFKQHRKYWMADFLETYSREDVPVGANEVNWAEDGKWYEKQTIKSITGAGTSTLVIVLNSTTQYFIEKDIVDLGVKRADSSFRNLMGRVTATGLDGSDQEITVELIGGVTAGDYAAGDFPANNEITLLYNTVGECWSIPEGRIHAPEKFTNQLNKIPNTHKMCDDSANRIIWFQNTVNGKFYWTDEEVEAVQELHKAMKDSACLFGQSHTFTDGSYSGVQGDGILSFLDTNSVKRSFAGSIIEDDLMDMLTDLGIYSKYNSWTLVCGPHMSRDINKALKDYHVNASVFYGRYSEDGNRLGINVTEYGLGGRSLKVMEYQPFGDPDFLPQNANSVNYLNFGMLLGGVETGESIQVCYKRRAKGGIMKNWVSVKEGPTFNESGTAVTDDAACMTTNIFSHFGVKVKGVQNHGLLIGE